MTEPNESGLDDPRWRERVDESGGDDGPTFPSPERSGPEEGDPDSDSDPDPDPVETGVALLSRLEHDELSVADALDRIEAITSAPERQREILETAERRGLVERDGARLRPAEGAGGGYVRFESEVVVRHGEFTCRRCGAAIGEGHFVRLDPGEVGPFGSSCVRTVLGRD